MLRLYNTLSRAKEEFVPLTPGKVHIYSCGPTVYDYAHIGNFRAFLFADVLKRHLRYRGYQVVHATNITDIDDKIIQRVLRDGVSLEDLTDKYAGIFLEDLQRLNVEQADIYPRATRHVEEMVALIERLVEKGLAYEREGSVYFSIARFPDYGRLARLDLSGLKAGARVDADTYDKEDVRDFVLWKARSESDGDIYWKSPFGPGRPGWHLECSCMSMKYLGESFDIHTGGVDLIFPHHQNEIAQSEGATGRPFVRYWMHNEFMNLNDDKMSKSAGNFYRLQDIAEKPEDFRAYRYMVVKEHYRTVMNFTRENLESSRSALRRLLRLRERLQEVERQGGDWHEQVERARRGFAENMDDDLNTPRALAAVFELVNEAEKALGQEEMGCQAAARVLAFLDEVNQVLGIFYQLEEEEALPGELPGELVRLLAEREAARARKDWAASDALRDELAAAGVVVRDTPQGTEWSWEGRGG